MCGGLAAAASLLEIDCCVFCRTALTECRACCLQYTAPGALLKQIVVKQDAGDGREAAAYSGGVCVLGDHCAAYISASDYGAERAGDDGDSIVGRHGLVPLDAGVSRFVSLESQEEGVCEMGL